MKAERIFGRAGLIEDAANFKFDPRKWDVIKKDIAQELEKYADKDVISKDLAVSLFDLYCLSVRDKWSTRTMEDMSNYVYDVFTSLERPEWENMISDFDDNTIEQAG